MQDSYAMLGTVRDDDPIELIARTIASIGERDRLMTCEITETALAAEPAIAAASVRRIADSRAAIALDGFGAGYGGGN